MNTAPTFQNCSIKANCPNNGFIIIDANFIIYLIEAICGRVEEKLESASRDDKFSSFSNILNSILENIKPCSLDGSLWTSDLVYTNEMSPLNRLSTLRREARRFETMCKQLNKNYQVVDRILKTHITETNTNNDDLDIIKAFYSSNPDDEDTSLICVSAMKSTPQFNTLLLTDDGGLCDRIEKIVQRKTLNLNGTDYPTGGIFPINFLIFLEGVHDCCNLSSDAFGYCMHHKYMIEDNRPNKFLKATKIKQVERVWYRFIESVLRKSAQLECA